MCWSVHLQGSSGSGTQLISGGGSAWIFTSVAALTVLRVTTVSHAFMPAGESSSLSEMHSVYAAVLWGHGVRLCLHISLEIFLDVWQLSDLTGCHPALFSHLSKQAESMKLAKLNSSE